MANDATNRNQYTPLSFDPSTPGTAACSKCGTALRGSYHLINDQIACAKCRYAAADRPGGDGALGRAALFGLGAAIVGSVAYYFLTKAIGYPMRLGAVLIGLGVVKAIRKGAGENRGTPYQLLAVALTWCAVGASFAPAVFSVGSEGVTRGVTSVSARAQATIDSIAAANEGGELDSVAQAKTKAAQLVLSRAKSFHMPVGVIVLTFVGTMLAGPIVGGFVNPFLWLGVGFAVYYGWKLNAGGPAAPVSVSGPYKLQGSPGIPPAA
jgi:hypothetical protein